MNKRWTDEENAIIIQSRQEGKTYKQMMELLSDRSLRAISVQGNKLTPSSRPQLKMWTEAEELELIRLREIGTPYPEIAEILGRTYIAVKSKGSNLICDGSMLRYAEQHAT